MTFQPKHIVTMVACVCATIVLAPVSVMAAGSFVTAVDPVTNAGARVSKDGSLRVESRAAASGDTFNVSSSAIPSLGFVKLVETPSPRRIVITDLSATAGSGINQSPTGYAARIEFVSLTRTSGTAACGYNAAGWQRKTLRWINVPVPSSQQLTFAGSPLLLPPAAAGQLTCVGVNVQTAISAAPLIVGVSGYTLMPS